jgi:hypothetical protein
LTTSGATRETAALGWMRPPAQPREPQRGPAHRQVELAVTFSSTLAARPRCCAHLSCFIGAAAAGPRLNIDHGSMDPTTTIRSRSATRARLTSTASSVPTVSSAAAKPSGASSRSRDSRPRRQARAAGLTTSPDPRSGLIPGFPSGWCCRWLWSGRCPGVQHGDGHADQGIGDRRGRLLNGWSSGLRRGQPPPTPRSKTSHSNPAPRGADPRRWWHPGLSGASWPQGQRPLRRYSVGGARCRSARERSQTPAETTGGSNVTPGPVSRIAPRSTRRSAVRVGLDGRLARRPRLRRRLAPRLLVVASEGGAHR